MNLLALKEKFVKKNNSHKNSHKKNENKQKKVCISNNK